MPCLIDRWAIEAAAHHRTQYGIGWAGTSREERVFAEDRPRRAATTQLRGCAAAVTLTRRTVLRGPAPPAPSCAGPRLTRAGFTWAFSVHVAVCVGDRLETLVVGAALLSNHPCPAPLSTGLLCHRLFAT
jgi:hypothetical protein